VNKCRKREHGRWCAEVGATHTSVSSWDSLLNPFAVVGREISKLSPELPSRALRRRTGGSDANGRREAATPPGIDDLQSSFSLARRQEGPHGAHVGV
jgi:hypothetical protein